AVQTFRGAAPGLTGRAAAPAGDFGAFDAETVVLGTVWRQEPELRAVTRAVTDRIPVSASAVHRRATARPASGTPAQEEPASDQPASDQPPAVQVAVLAGAAQEAAWIARELRAEHLLRGTPWERMAVVARSGTRLSALRRELVSASVPVALLGSDLPLRDEPA